MITRIVLGSFLGAVLLFLVGFVWWGLPVGPGASAMHQAPQEAEFQAALADHLPESGAYLVPHMAVDDEQAIERFQQRHEAGPLAIVVFHRGGKDPADPMNFLFGFLHGLLSCTLAAGLVAAVAADRWFLVRWGSVAFLGLFLAVFENLAGQVWWSEPTDWFLAHASYNIVAWVVAGLPIAALVRRKD